MSHESILQKAMQPLREEGFRQFNPHGPGPRSFGRKAKGYLAKRAVRVIHRLAPSYVIREIRKLDQDQRDVPFLVDFLFTRFLGLIRPSQVRSEITGLCNIVKELKPKTVLEIGTAKGGTLFLFSRLADPEAIVVSVDLPGGRYGGGYPRWKIPLYEGCRLDKQSMHLLRADSHAMDTLEKVKSILGGRSVDLLFIDADHTYEGVKRDFELYSPLVRSGGVIAFHDIVTHPPEYGCGVDRYWQEIKGPDSREFIEDVNQGWAGIGIL
jgi:predicted O-methyltransferase YrrM